MCGECRYKTQIPELVQSLTQGTGVLYIDENNLVNFKHNFFMEYYASREIFNHQRELEDELINRFIDFNWQNTAIFYSGRTKDMPKFLIKVIEKFKQYESIIECLVGISGMGYLLQALWLTDASIRKEGIKTALNASLQSLEQMKKLASEKGNFFSLVQYPTLVLVNTLFFYKDFTSITLKDPLVLAFEDLLQEFKQMKANNDWHKTAILYQLRCAPKVGQKIVEIKVKKVHYFFQKTRLEKQHLVSYNSELDAFE